MHKFECSCNSRSFFVHKKDNMVQCLSCRQRFVFRNGAWVKFNAKKEFMKKVAEVIATKMIEPFKETVTVVKETTGQWMKRHGIVKEKKTKYAEHNINPFTRKVDADEIIKKKEIEEKHIRKKWFVEIYGLNKYPSVIINKNYHNGKLRGRDAARACHSDLKKLGIKTKITFQGNGAAILELRK